MKRFSLLALLMAVVIGVAYSFAWANTASCGCGGCVESNCDCDACECVGCDCAA